MMEAFSIHIQAGIDVNLNLLSLTEHPADAYNVVQGATDLAIATRFAAMLRNGALDGNKYSKIVGIGHSCE